MSEHHAGYAAGLFETGRLIESLKLAEESRSLELRASTEVLRGVVSLMRDVKIDASEKSGAQFLVVFDKVTQQAQQEYEKLHACLGSIQTLDRLIRDVKIKYDAAQQRADKIAEYENRKNKTTVDLFDRPLGADIGNPLKEMNDQSQVKPRKRKTLAWPSYSTRL